MRVEGHGIRTYYGRPDGTKIDVAAAIPIDDDVGPIAGVEIVELPAAEVAATVIHRGPAGEVADAWQTFEVATDDHDLVPFGLHRQVHLETSEDSDRWVVELQCPVRPRGRARPASEEHA